MKNLSKEEKAQLEILLKSPGFRILEWLIGDFETRVLKSLKTINLANETELKLLNAKQNYLKWCEDLLATLKAKTNKIGTRDF